MLDPDSKYIVLRDGSHQIQLRSSLFWDLPEGSIDLKKNRRLILERVFSRGNVEEFKQINLVYKEKEIRKTVLQIGTFDKKTLHFLSVTYHLKPSDFKCSTEKP
jgi:hypothetical protein